LDLDKDPNPSITRIQDTDIEHKCDAKINARINIMSAEDDLINDLKVKNKNLEVKLRENEFLVTELNKKLSLKCEECKVLKETSKTLDKTVENCKYK